MAWREVYYTTMKNAAGFSTVSHRIFHAEPTNTISVIYGVSFTVSHPHYIIIFIIILFSLPWPILSPSLYEIAHRRDLSNTEEASPFIEQESSFN